jgi:hypothetical protein
MTDGGRAAGVLALTIVLGSACGGNGPGGNGGAGGTSSSSGGTGGSGGSSSGGGGAGGTTLPDICTSFAACGGNVVGTWGIHRACVPPTSVTGGTLCQGQTFDVAKVVSDFSWTFRADLSLAAALSASGTGSVTTPSPCVTPAGASVACADVGPMYLNLRFAGATTSVGACVESNGSCTCPLTFTAAPQNGTGTYSTSGNTLNFTFGSDPATASYCATASTLTIMGANPTGKDGSVGVYDRR